MVAYEKTSNYWILYIFCYFFLYKMEYRRRILLCGWSLDLLMKTITKIKEAVKVIFYVELVILFGWLIKIILETEI
jgi:hypothetical protein